MFFISKITADAYGYIFITFSYSSSSKIFPFVIDVNMILLCFMPNQQFLFS